MPLLELSELKGNPVFVGETEFLDPDNESEHVKLFIYMAKPVFNEDSLQVSFQLKSVSSVMKYFKNNHLSGQNPLC